MDKVKYTMKGLLHSEDSPAVQAVGEAGAGDEFVDDAQQPDDGIVHVDYSHESSVEAIEVPSIVDTYGRLSDIIEAFEMETGMSVIPLVMANIAPEVKLLQRHEIFEFMGERYAMSRVPREQVIKEWQDKILSNLSTGLTFEEDLMTNVSYNNQTYKTLTLSRVEWTLLLSKFRYYKQDLVVRNEKNIVMVIFAERVAG